jgi:signal transduction histidine kinase
MSRSKSEFLANMSHELRTPLNGVIGFSDLLAKSLLNDADREYAENINNSANFLLGVINDILDFSKIESGKMELDIIKSDISKICRDAMGIVRFTASEKSLELIVNIPDDVPGFAYVDPLRLKQILVNLLGNAVKFTSSGEIELKVLFRKIDSRRGIFTYSVRDTGIGIGPGEQEKLFKAFSQADSSTTRKFGGTGLGLVISSMLADKMGSRIELKSEPGKGSVFSSVLRVSMLIK